MSYTDDVYEVYWVKDINADLNTFCAGTEDWEIIDFSGNKLDKISFKEVYPDKNLPIIVPR